MELFLCVVALIICFAVVWKVGKPEPVVIPNQIWRMGNYPWEDLNERYPKPPIPTSAISAAPPMSPPIKGFRVLTTEDLIKTMGVPKSVFLGRS